MDTHSKRWTWLGLAIALFGVPLVIIAYRSIVGDTTAASQQAAREVAILALFAVLLWIIRSGEKLPLSSIGLRFDKIGWTLLWSLVGLVLLGAATAAAFGLLGVLKLKYISSNPTHFVAPMWVVLLTVLRAGIVEETFYRGYAIERLQALTGSRVVAVAVPLVAFALFHYRGGIAGILIALVLGAVLTGFYLWKRNLLANIVAHFLIDFIPNILLPLIAPN